MGNKRIKLGPLNTAGAVASENRWVYRQLKAGNMEGRSVTKSSSNSLHQTTGCGLLKLPQDCAALRELCAIRRASSQGG